jgi:hypothetical protein
MARDLTSRCRFGPTPVAIDLAERVAGKRLDRRRSYAVIEGEVCTLGRWSEPCTGCSDDREYVMPTRGAGCEECGHTGMRRVGWWAPICEDAEVEP